eukprot:TRINITY_DN66013_c9_g3_i2.p1 TRINITY_DN66013_c9_g3~~TRINITY_DN66013_c9_g3_i2.p1  ORF type:complete len:193 (-),score=10.68 TRINITY_DN66013_c9_g3_i2:103-681(-)
MRNSEADPLLHDAQEISLSIFILALLGCVVFFPTWFLLFPYWRRIRPSLQPRHKYALGAAAFGSATVIVIIVVAVVVADAGNPCTRAKTLAQCHAATGATCVWCYDTASCTPFHSCKCSQTQFTCYWICAGQVFGHGCPECNTQPTCSACKDVPNTGCKCHWNGAWCCEDGDDKSCPKGDTKFYSNLTVTQK